MDDTTLQKWISKVDDRLTKIETILEERLGGYPDVVRVVTQLCTRLDEHERRIEDLEGSQQWVSRLVMGAVITAIVALVLARGGM
jgi:hypothetical protein